MALIVCVAEGACAKPKKVKVDTPGAPAVGSTETGLASWYGYPYHGRRAANGEIYDMEKMVAAHRTLPFDTWVEVSNIENDKSVQVRIIDRGPFVDGRIIDLSHAAAQAIGLIGPGVAQVRLRVVAGPPPDEPVLNLYAVQIGAFRDRSRAERIKAKFEPTFGKVRIVPKAGKETLWRVLVGNEPTQEAANALAGRIRTPDQPAFVVRVDEVSESAATRN